MYLYSDLEITKEATHQEIKDAHRKLALKYHPDKNPGNEDKFRKAIESYSILGDENLRIIYNYGKYDAYSKIKPKIISAINYAPDFFKALINIADYRITTNYTRINLLDDLREGKFDKIFAILTHCYYTNDELFIKTYYRWIGIVIFFVIVEKFIKMIRYSLIWGPISLGFSYLINYSFVKCFFGSIITQILLSYAKPLFLTCKSYF